MINHKDPTRTLTLRNKAVSQINRRFIAIKGVINKSLLSNKIFTNAEAAPKGRFTYLYDAQKIDEFMLWLHEQIEAEILQATVPVERHWLNVFIGASYVKGVNKTRTALHREYEKRGIDISSSVFANPAHVKRAELIYTRVFSQLTGVTAAMEQQIARELSDGIIRGKGIREISKNLNDRVEKIGKTRARLIARTEIVNAHNLASIEEGKELEKLIDEEVKYKWIATLDSKLRDEHRHWNGKVFTKKETLSKVGAPRCRCAVTAWLPEYEK